MDTIELTGGTWRYHIRQTTSHKECTFRLIEPDTNLYLSVLVEAIGESAPSLKLRVEHCAPHTTAQILVHTIATDHAAPHFSGLLRIEPEGRGSSSTLSHHSLLLGPNAQSFTLPSLEILHNEVTCTHASTCQTISEEDIFPLQARGIPRREAEHALLDAFRQAVQPDKETIIW
jgi:Fe-S cluster assembly protein SufD